MNKPTAQELWERIALEISKIALCSGAPHPCAEILQTVNSYAQTYHEEQMRYLDVKPRKMKTCIHCNVKEIGHCSDPKCTNFSNQPNQ